MKILCLLTVIAAVAFAGAAEMSINSPAFKPGGMIPVQFSCKGANQNPPLQFKGVPAGTKSLVLIIDDPDAPGGVFNHWLVWNIDPMTTQIAADNVPAGAVQGENDFGKPGYGGPCPPALHRYFFRLIALDRKLDLAAGAKRSALDRAMAGHIIGRGEIMARFGR